MATRRTPFISAAMAACMALAAGAASAQSDSYNESDAADYCSSSGGQVVKRTAYLDTEVDRAGWIRLGTHMATCQFVSGEGEDADQITVDLVTLYSEEPTLAGLAYLSKLPYSASNGPVSPGYSYCLDDLGGTELSAPVGSAGGWVDLDQSDWQVLDLCIFGDTSAIDDFGLFYHSADVTRGIDLSTVMRYQPDGSLPPLFQSGSDT